MLQDDSVTLSEDESTLLKKALNGLTRQQQWLLRLKLSKGMSITVITKVASKLDFESLDNKEKVYEQMIDALFGILEIYQDQLLESIKTQQHLFPAELPEIPNIELAAHNLPALGVSGDFYDFIEIDDNRVGIVIGDVCGKGIPAGFLVVSTRSSLRTAVQQGCSVAETLAYVNKIIHQDSLREKYVTLVYGVFDKTKMSFNYGNAGHSTPFLYRSRLRKPKELKTGGSAIGIWRDSTYEQEELSLQPQNLLLMYTDGLTEATGKRNRLFGEQRIHRVVKRNAHKGVKTVINNLIFKVKDFCGGTLQDDVTLIALKVKGASSPTCH